MLLGNARRLKHIIFQLPLCRRRINNNESYQKHTLVAALQILQKLFRFCAVSRQIRGNYVHIVACAYRPLLFLNFLTVEVSYFMLNLLNCRRLVDRLNMQAHNLRTIHIQKVSQHTVV